jgi:hypothetical protein
MEEIEKAFQQALENFKKEQLLSTEERLQKVNNEIAVFEQRYNQSFETYYGTLSSREIDGLNEAVDIFDWQELIAFRNQLRKQLAEQKK